MQAEVEFGEQDSGRASHRRAIAPRTRPPSRHAGSEEKPPSRSRAAMSSSGPRVAIVKPAEADSQVWPAKARPQAPAKTLFSQAMPTTPWQDATASPRDRRGGRSAAPLASSWARLPSYPEPSLLRPRARHRRQGSSCRRRLARRHLPLRGGCGCYEGRVLLKRSSASLSRAATDTAGHMNAYPARRSRAGCVAAAR